MRETLSAKRERVLHMMDIFDRVYDDAACTLDYKNALQLLIATQLAAQCTDARVNIVTKDLFVKYPDVYAFANADELTLQEDIRSTGFFRNKAKNCVACAQMIMSDFGGEVPRDMKSLQKLPGVGRKTANIVLNEGFGIVEGIAVDTHVFRIAHRLKFSNADTPLQTEQDLLKLYPRECWGPINHQWVLFGRETCIARKPKCAECFLNDLCPSAFKQG